MNSGGAGQAFPATVLGPGDGSWFVARADEDGAEYDVHGVVPGDRVVLRAVPGFRGRADVVALLVPGPGRRTPPCPLAGVCGGCHWLWIDEPVQRELRRRRVLAELERAGVPWADAALTAPPGPDRSGCRCRARFQTDLTGGRLVVGHHRLGSRQSIDVPDCPMLAPETRFAYQSVRDVLRAAAPPDVTGFELTALPGAAGALVRLNPRDRVPHGWERLARCLLDADAGALAGVAVGGEAVDGIVPWIGERWVTGRTPAGQPVAAAVGSFVQSNLGAADQLADDVARLVNVRPGAKVLELFAGAGLLGWRAAQSGADVAAVEIDPLAVAAARALPPPVPGRWSLRVMDAKAALEDGGACPDAVIADPPRPGLGPLAHTLVRGGPARVILVSCSATSMARDVAVLVAGGYELAHLTLWDLFPQTRHTEAVALLLR